MTTNNYSSIEAASSTGDDNSRLPSDDDDAFLEREARKLEAYEQQDKTAKLSKILGHIATYRRTSGERRDKRLSKDEAITAERSRIRRERRIAARLEKDRLYQANKRAAERKTVERAKPKATLAIAKDIRAEAARRESSLKKFTASSTSPRAVKVRGREALYVRVWTAREVANIKAGGQASLAEIAGVMQRRTPTMALDRYQVHRALDVITALEEAGVWKATKQRLPT